MPWKGSPVLVIKKWFKIWDLRLLMLKISVIEDTDPYEKGDQPLMSYAFKIAGLVKFPLEERLHFAP